jgi:hypothetical protein
VLAVPVPGQRQGHRDRGAAQPDSHADANTHAHAHAHADTHADAGPDPHAAAHSDPDATAATHARDLAGGGGQRADAPPGGVGPGGRRLARAVG